MLKIGFLCSFPPVPIWELPHRTAWRPLFLWCPSQSPFLFVVFCGLQPACLIQTSNHCLFWFQLGHNDCHLLTSLHVQHCVVRGKLGAVILVEELALMWWSKMTSIWPGKERVIVYFQKGKVESFSLYVINHYPWRSRYWSFSIKMHHKHSYLFSVTTCPQTILVLICLHRSVKTVPQILSV